MMAMTDQSAIDQAVKRLALALDALDAAVERRREADRSEEGLASQLHALGVDRTRLAAALDGEAARSRRLEIDQPRDRAAAGRGHRQHPVGAGLATSDLMAQVNATIAGRQYRLACEDGQEEHLLALAHDLDQRIIELRAKFGEIGDTRLTMMAALMVADELSEAARKIRRLEEEATGLQDARVVASDRAKAASNAVVNAFNSAAERIEGITKKLNASLGNGVAIG